jgi:DNA-binding CsgD family transcriptional regulator
VSDIEIPSLIGDIYDAALDPSSWNKALTKTCDYVGGSGATLFSKDAQSKTGIVFYHGGDIDLHYTQLYFEKYVKLDPSTSAHVLAEIEQPISTIDIMPHSEFYQSRFYKEWGAPQGLVDFITAALDKTATGAALFGVFRKEEHGIVDDDTRWRVRQIVPHIRRAVIIGKVIERKTAEAATFAETFDGLSAGMFLVDESGRIVHANASGRKLLAEGPALRDAGGRITSPDGHAARALNEIVAAAADGDEAVGVRGIALPINGRDGEQYAAHVLPLTSGSRRSAGAKYTSVAAVFVRKAAIEASSPPEVIARKFNLTPSELRVLLATVEIGGVPDVANALGIGEATVKTHLHRVFGKTGTGRQADLVKLVASYANPLLN